VTKLLKIFSVDNM